MAESSDDVSFQITQRQISFAYVVREKIISPDITSNTIGAYSRNQIWTLTNLMGQHNGAVSLAAGINRIFTIHGKRLAQLAIEPKATETRLLCVSCRLVSLSEN